MVRPKKHCQYTPEEMKSAIDAVQTEGFSVSKAALLYNVPRKTLSDRISGTYENPKRGPINFNSRRRRIPGHLYNTVPPGCQKDIWFSDIVKQSARKNQFMDSGPSEHWWFGFRNRNKHRFTLRTPDNLDRGRGRMSNYNVINRHLNTLRKLLMKMTYWTNQINFSLWTGIV